MNRRSVLALFATVPIAGCSSLLGSGVDASLGEDEVIEFDSDAGAELTVSVEVEEVFPLDSDVEHEREGVGFRLDHTENGIVETRTIEDEETFEVTVEDDGTHAVMLIGGEGHVTIE
ncbi:hypothetical protein C482_04951 [Natrialba chahannaoensis JCM 10990]|uniref:Uncharacterized protein n=1 Tax=Natrialba chahannaoensis JCM 10990 TaxID=1227492 RepID=M0AXC8_9EURY|nr:hypothetical protein [Natrialba chahannaoensis]ELZ02977.1 hypothetical protein C482_04951 [Natrialba chahannaoensis JCM 10990]